MWEFFPSQRPALGFTTQSPARRVLSAILLLLLSPASLRAAAQYLDDSGGGP